MKIYKIFTFYGLILLLTLHITIVLKPIDLYAQSGNLSQFEKNKERWDKLSPEEKERIIRNYERWKELPEAKRAVIKQRAKVFQMLPIIKQLKIKERAKLIKPKLAAKHKLRTPKEPRRRKDLLSTTSSPP